MKVLVFGAGVIGSYFATRLSHSDVDVSMFARGDKFLNIKEKGVILEDFFNHNQTLSRVRVIEEPDQEAYDLVLVTVQMIHVRDVLPILMRFRNAKSFLFIGNNVNGFAYHKAYLGHKNIMAGFITVGGKSSGHTVIFTDADPTKPREKAPLVLGRVNEFETHEFNRIRQLFEEANIMVQIEEDIDGWLKTHTGMILGLASASYLKGHNIKEVAEDDELIKQIVKALRESMKVLKSLGITIVPKKNRILHLLPAFFLVTIFRKLLSSDYAEIAIAGHAEAARNEMRALADGFLVLCNESDVSYSTFKKLTDSI